MKHIHRLIVLSATYGQSSRVTPELLAAISGWIGRRYGVQVAENRLMVLNGTPA